MAARTDRAGTHCGIGATGAGAACLEAELHVLEVGCVFRFPGWVMGIPRWPVPALRGLLGHALKRRDERAGADAELYDRVFKVAAPGTPAPFLLFCVGGGHGSELPFTLRLFGTGEEVLDACVGALAESGGHGLGPKPRIPYTLKTGRPRAREAPWDPQWSPSGATRFRLTFLTPAQLTLLNIELGRPDVAMDLNRLLAGREHARAFLHTLVQSSARRLLAPRAAGRPCGLATAYGRAEALEPATNRALQRLADESAIRRSDMCIEEVSWRERYVGGIVGSVELTGPPELERVLQSAALTGIGKCTSFGCGQVRVEPL